MVAVSGPTAAKWIADNSLKEIKHKGNLLAALAVVFVQQKKSIVDFSRCAKFSMAFGDGHIQRIAISKYTSEIPKTIKTMSTQYKRVFIELWEEDKHHQRLREDLQAVWLCSRIRSTGEIIGVYQISGQKVSVTHRSSDDLSLAQLDISKNKIMKLVNSLTQKLQGLTFKNHYSNYNKDKAWSAVALRGYGGDVMFIEKPSEMLRSWQKKNSEKLHWKIQDTSLRKQLDCEELIGLIPGVKQRIRLMRLSPGGGELQRHTDNCDPDAGTAPGQLLRIHIPIQTNPKVEFCCWSQRGQQQKVNMKIGEVWYLDTRKPHTAINYGDRDRIHLVMDVESNERLLQLLGVD